MKITKEQIIREYEKFYQNTKHLPTLAETISAMFKAHGVNTSQKFSELTGLSPSLFTTLQKEGHKVSLQHILSIISALRLDPVTANRILADAGYIFSNNLELHKKYVYVFQKFPAQDYVTKNAILQMLGVPPHLCLGSYERAPYRRKEKTDTAN